MTTPDRPTWWTIPLGGSIGNVLGALVVIGVGFLYDERGRAPGAMVWVGVLMILPGWLVVALLQRSKELRWREEQRPVIEMVQDLRELRSQVKDTGSITGVLETVAPLPQGIKESADDGQRR